MAAYKKWHNPIGYMSKDMMHSVLKLIIMNKIKRGGKMYPYAIVKEIKGIKHPFVSGNPQLKNIVYNTLKALEQAGYVKAVTSGSGATTKVYYTLTADGRNVLKRTKELARETARSMIRILR
jgi:DNA-binding PadR family transcriptional regulator